MSLRTTDLLLPTPTTQQQRTAVCRTQETTMSDAMSASRMGELLAMPAHGACCLSGVGSVGRANALEPAARHYSYEGEFDMVSMLLVYLSRHAFPLSGRADCPTCAHTGRRSLPESRRGRRGEWRGWAGTNRRRSATAARRHSNERAGTAWWRTGRRAEERGTHDDAVHDKIRAGTHPWHARTADLVRRMVSADPDEASSRLMLYPERAA